MKRVLLSFLVVIVLLTVGRLPSYASGIGAIPNNNVSDSISKEGKDFLITHYREMLQIAFPQEKIEKMIICQPYVIYDPAQKTLTRFIIFLSNLMVK